MKIIKNYGRSDAAPKGEGEKSNQRKLVIFPKFTQSDKKKFCHKVYDFATEDPNIVIAQWISVIDKIAAKPKGTKPPSLATYDFREKLGAVCWEIIKDEASLIEYCKKPNHKNIEHYEKIWAWKLHPYKGRNQNKFAKGRLSEIFHDSVTAQEAGKLFPEQYSLMAQKIKEHLYDNRLKMSGRGFNEKGLIELRATSIERNTLANNFAAVFPDPKATAQGQAPLKKKRPTIEQKYFGEIAWKDSVNLFTGKSFNLAEKIYVLCLKQIKQQQQEEKKKKYKNIHISYDEIIGAIKRHYGEVLGTRNTMCDLRKDPKKESILQLYDAIKDYYKKLICGKKKIRNVTLLLPRNDTELLDILEKKQKNRAINELVRLGRVLYYEAGTTNDETTVHQDDHSIWSCKNKYKLAESYYFSSTGQADIKSSEAFVRVWRSAVTMANRSFTNLTKLGAMDVLGGKDPKTNKYPIDCVLAKPDTDFNHLALLFGQSTPLSAATSKKQIVASMIDDAMIIRNNTFHFRNQTDFANIVKKELDSNKPRNKNIDLKEYENYIELAKKTLKKDTETWEMRNYFALKAAGLDRFIPKESFEAFLKIARVDLQDYTFNFTLPKFSALLQRHKNINSAIALPAPPNQDDFKDNPPLLAKYTAYKILYEEAFLAWLSKRCRHCLNEFAEKAIKRTSKAAKKLSDGPDELIEAQASKLPKFEKEETITHLTAKLTAATASEMRVQKGYNSDSEKAREQAEWINNFKMDFILEALSCFLEKKKDILDPISELNKNSGRKSEGYELDPPKERHALPDWASKLYVFLHFIPVSECNLVYQQFLKWGALQSKHDLQNEQKKEANTELVNTIKQVFVLYCKMHDDVYSGNLGEENRDQRFEFDYRLYEDFYETPGHIKDVLNLNREDKNKTPSNVIRGLREIARFGELDLLKKIRDNAGIKKITQEDIDKAKTSESVENAHKGIKELREKRGSGRKWSKEEVEKYACYVKKISTHREAKAITTLHDYIVVHNILNALFARMADYAGLWERDHFFIQLAVIWLHGKKPGEIIKRGYHKNNFSRNQPIPDDEFFKDPKIQQDIQPIKGTLENLGINNFTNGTNNFFQDKKDIRDSLAHFNYLQNLENGEKDFTSLVNSLRDLMNYDRKLKNSVTKSLQDILAREGFTLSWDMDKDHKLKLQRRDRKNGGERWLEVEQIKHLQKISKKPIEEPRHTKRAEQLLRTALSKKLYT